MQNNVLLYMIYDYKIYYVPLQKNLQFKKLFQIKLTSFFFIIKLQNL